jgi:hypothetical protein
VSESGQAVDTLVGPSERANLNHWTDPVFETITHHRTPHDFYVNYINQLKTSAIKPSIIIFCHSLDLSLSITDIDILRIKCSHLFLNFNSSYRDVLCDANTATKKLRWRVSKRVTNGSKTDVKDVIGFLCLSVGSSTVQLHDSLRSGRTYTCSEVGFSSQNGDRA